MDAFRSETRGYGQVRQVAPLPVRNHRWTVIFRPMTADLAEGSGFAKPRRLSKMGLTLTFRPAAGRLFSQTFAQRPKETTL